MTFVRTEDSQSLVQRDVGTHSVPYARANIPILASLDARTTFCPLE